MADLLGKIVVFLGRFALLPRRVARQEVERRGGVVQRGLTRRSDLLVIGRGACSLLETGQLDATLDRAERGDTLWVSEKAFLRRIGRLPPPARGNRTLALDELARQAGLAAEVVRVLAAFDLIEDQHGRYGFRDLVVAREAAGLLDDGIALAAIVRGALQVDSRGGMPGEHHLARLKLVRDHDGRLAMRMGDHLAELDGQLRLPLGNTLNLSIDELFEAAEAAEQEHNLTAAASLYRRCVSLDRSDPIAPFNLANVLREQGKRAEAALFLRLAVARDPAFAEAWYNLGSLLEAEGRIDLAHGCLTQATTVDPDFADALFNLARLEFEAGAYAEAGRCWERYLELDPVSAWSRVARHGVTLCRHHLRRSLPKR